MSDPQIDAYNEGAAAERERLIALAEGMMGEPPGGQFTAEGWKKALREFMRRAKEEA